jgi:hypothetical protein
MLKAVDFVLLILIKSCSVILLIYFGRRKLPEPYKSGAKHTDPHLRRLKVLQLRQVGLFL